MAWSITPVLEHWPVSRSLRFRSNNVELVRWPKQVTSGYSTMGISRYPAIETDIFTVRGHPRSELVGSVCRLCDVPLSYVWPQANRAVLRFFWVTNRPRYPIITELLSIFVTGFPHKNRIYWFMDFFNASESRYEMRTLHFVITFIYHQFVQQY